MQRKKTPEEIRRSELISELIKLDGLKTVEDAQNFSRRFWAARCKKCLLRSLTISSNTANTINATKKTQTAETATVMFCKFVMLQRSL